VDRSISKGIAGISGIAGRSGRSGICAARESWAARECPSSEVREWLGLSVCPSPQARRDPERRGCRASLEAPGPWARWARRQCRFLRNLGGRRSQGKRFPASSPPPSPPALFRRLALHARLLSHSRSARPPYKGSSAGNRTGRGHRLVEAVAGVEPSGGFTALVRNTTATRREWLACTASLLEMDFNGFESRPIRTASKCGLSRFSTLSPFPIRWSG